MMTANRADTLFRREGVIEMHGHAAREEKSLRHALAGKEVEKVGANGNHNHLKLCPAGRFTTVHKKII